MKNKNNYSRFFPMIGSPVRLPIKIGLALYEKEYKQWIDFGKDCQLKEPQLTIY
jgi:hypothetical protein